MEDVAGVLAVQDFAVASFDYVSSDVIANGDVDIDVCFLDLALGVLPLYLCYARRAHRPAAPPSCSSSASSCPSWPLAARSSPNSAFRQAFVSPGLIPRARRHSSPEVHYAVVQVLHSSRWPSDSTPREPLSTTASYGNWAPSTAAVSTGAQHRAPTLAELEGLVRPSSAASAGPASTPPTPPSARPRPGRRGAPRRYHQGRSQSRAHVHPQQRATRQRPLPPQPASPWPGRTPRLSPPAS